MINSGRRLLHYTRFKCSERLKLTAGCWDTHFWTGLEQIINISIRKKFPIHSNLSADVHKGFFVLEWGFFYIILREKNKRSEKILNRGGVFTHFSAKQLELSEAN